MSAAPTDDSDAASDYSSSSSFNHHRLQQEAVNKLSSLATDHDRQSKAEASVSSRSDAKSKIFFCEILELDFVILACVLIFAEGLGP